MKKTFFVTVFTILFFSLQAQTLESGRQHNYYERYQSAESNFHEVVKNQPNNAEAWYELTKTYLLQNELNKSLDSLRLAPSQIHEDPFYKVAYGYVLLSQNKKDSAALFFNKALDQTRQKDAMILSAIAQAHIEAKASDANYAIELVDKALKRDKRNPALYVLLGDAYKKLNNGSDAYAAYKKAFEEDKNYAAAYHKTGEIFLTQKNAEVYLEYFNKAIAADPQYAPSLHDLYTHHFYYDPAKALQYYNQYLASSDPSDQNGYDLADLFYINKQYDKAIQKANSIIAAERVDIKPRLYKLLAHSYEGMQDSLKAMSYMKQYFAMEADSNFTSKDHVAMGDMFAWNHQPDSAIVYYQNATEVEKDSAILRGYYKKLAEFSGSSKDYAMQASWLQKFYQGNERVNNIDLFDWGLAHFRAEDYGKADSVFGLYVSKYPEQSFGYYWQARSNSLLDSTMEMGTAVPLYQKLIDVLQKDSANANYKNWMVTAYGYLASYEANQQKDYPEAVTYFEKVLEVDPANDDAKKYIAILEKSIANSANK